MIKCSFQKCQKLANWYCIVLEDNDLCDEHFNLIGKGTEYFIPAEFQIQDTTYQWEFDE